MTGGMIRGRRAWLRCIAPGPPTGRREAAEGSRETGVGR
jgi:hypothetical protein